MTTLYNAPIDIEGALVDALNIDASAYPVPPNFGAVLPFCVIQRTGGAAVSRVLSEHDVSFDCYATTWSAAADYAGVVCAAVDALNGATLEGITCPRAVLRTLPYNNPDPVRPDIPRVTFSATLTTRTTKR